MATLNPTRVRYAGLSGSTGQVPVLPAVDAPGRPSPIDATWLELGARIQRLESLVARCTFARGTIGCGVPKNQAGVTSQHGLTDTARDTETLDPGPDTTSKNFGMQYAGNPRSRYLNQPMIGYCEATLMAKPSTQAQQTIDGTTPEKDDILSKKLQLAAKAQEKVEVAKKEYEERRAAVQSYMNENEVEDYTDPETGHRAELEEGAQTLRIKRAKVPAEPAE